MTKAQRRELAKYVRAAADALGLRDWTIHLEEGTLPERKGVTEGMRWNAACESVPGRKHATLTFAPYFAEGSPTEVRNTVVHELVHCHFAALWHQARMDLLDHFGQQGYDVFVASFERNLEYGVDAVAEALAPRLPPIRWPE